MVIIIIPLLLLLIIIIIIDLPEVGGALLLQVAEKGCVGRLHSHLVVVNDFYCYSISISNMIFQAMLCI